MLVFNVTVHLYTQYAKMSEYLTVGQFRNRLLFRLPTTLPPPPSPLFLSALAILRFYVCFGSCFGHKMGVQIPCEFLVKFFGALWQFGRHPAR